MSLPKVFVAAPTSAYKDYCFHEWKEQVLSFDYPNYDVALCDNTDDDGQYTRWLWRNGIQSLHLNRESPQFPKSNNPFEVLALSMNVLREVFLREQYDYWLILETDIFVPEWIIPHLIAYPYRVVNVSYLLWEGEATAPALHILHQDRTIMASPFSGFSTYDGQCRDMFSNSISHDMKLAGTGYGCTMVHRSVVERVPFRIDPENDQRLGKLTAPDSLWHIDLKALGINDYLDTSIIAEHRRGNWNQLFKPSWNK